ncbi:hypothetical protein MalM25_24880 [Planctomycetes bacterium MalM25]|nr:hypothetical protein MalM25_24880 [Planctomycetes bacterium MalM25]
MTSPTHKRKQKFIDPEVQGALARRIGVHWLLYTLVASVLVVGLKWLANPFVPITEHAIEAWWTYGPLLLVLICLAPIFIYDSVKLSNRFTGPMMRIRQATKSLAKGERVRPLTFRGDDFWQDLAKDFNQIVDRYEPNDDKPNEPSA